MTDPTQSDRWPLARHEAAHAVVGYVLGHHVASVSITPSEHYEGVAYVGMSDAFTKERDWQLWVLRNLAVVTIAGEVASGFSSQRDYDNIIRYGLEAVPNGPQRRKQWMFDRYRQAVRIVTDHRRLIDVVAAALIEHGTLTEDQFLLLVHGVQRRNIR